MKPLPFRVTRPALLTAVCALLSAGSALAVTGNYAVLAPSKALAVVPGSPDIHGISHDQANDLMASSAAVRICESKRDPSHPPCEVQRLNNEHITSGAEIFARVPDRPHPLNLWKLRGRLSTVYLAGSIHILKSSLYPLPAQYEQAFRASDALVLEVDISRYTPAELRHKSQAYTTLDSTQKLMELLPPPLFNRLSTRLESYGVPESSYNNRNPAYLMNQLVMLRLLALGYHQDYGIEQHFLAKLARREVFELETLDDQLALLFDQPMALQIEQLGDALDQETEIEPMIADMISAWLAGEDALFMQMFERQAGVSEMARAFNDELLNQRNIGMAEKIKDYLAGEGTYFVLVGAAHLIGEKGVVALLNAADINSQRIMSDARITTSNRK